MGLREIAEQDLGSILEDTENGFGWDITLTTPSGDSADLVGFSNDISLALDPETGQMVSGRIASVAIRNALIFEALPGAGLPLGIADSNAKPWLVSFADINGTSYTFRVAESDPDRSIGLVVLILELYSGG